MTISHLNLGASLYVPATRPDISSVVNGERHSGLRSVILCTEDSILFEDVERALENLRYSLPRIGSQSTLVFIRPRNLEIFARILSLRGVERIDGFVVPKATSRNIAAYATMAPEHFLLMPTLETREVFDFTAMAEMREVLSSPGIRTRVLALRIGGNDILNLLGTRRRPGCTIYETVAGPVIASLVSIFRPHGFSLTAPVFDNFGDFETLEEEVARDLDHGLVAKAAIHPVQITKIERRYRVRGEDLKAARAIVAKDAPAVFQVDQVMCEPATHFEWANSIIKRAEIYGIAESNGISCPGRRLAAS